MLENSPLGQKTPYVDHYSPQLLYPIPRSLARDPLNLPSELPFMGYDLWNGFELSWLNKKGKPEIAMATFRFPLTTPFIIESKSFKLYLNSFNQSFFNSLEEVEEVMRNDLSQGAQGEVNVELFHPEKKELPPLSKLGGFCLDHLDISVDHYRVNANFLKVHPEKIKERVYSNLLKSNCLATGQPDWGSIQIEYEGSKIDHEGLLKYIISFRNHSGFAEHCAEKIFWDIWKGCQPDKLAIAIRYTRRGGLDINPYRSSFEKEDTNTPTWRQ